MNTTSLIPATQNKLWGFWGTMDEHAEAAWPLAMTAIANATGQPLESVRFFLDSLHGRHFANNVLNEMRAGWPIAEAIRAAAQQWMSWTIGRQTSKNYGIPRGIPYLTGHVLSANMSEEH